MIDCMYKYEEHESDLFTAIIEEVESRKNAAYQFYHDSETGCFDIELRGAITGIAYAIMLERNINN